MTYISPKDVDVNTTRPHPATAAAAAAVGGLGSARVGARLPELRLWRGVEHSPAYSPGGGAGSSVSMTIQCSDDINDGVMMQQWTAHTVTAQLVIDLIPTHRLWAQGAGQTQEGVDGSSQRPADPAGEARLYM